MDLKKATMRDVARLAGVAVGTVDRYLNGSGYISDAKRDCVRRAVEELRYVPNKAARALSRGSAINIGMIFPNVEESFWQQIEHGSKRAAKEYEAYGLQIHRIRLNEYNVEMQLKAIDELVSKNNVQGIAMVPVHESRINEAISRLADDGIPVVTFDSDAPLSRRICFIGEDSRKGGEIAARVMALLLHENGKIAVFRGQRNLFAVTQRIVGFGQKIAEYPYVHVAAEYDIYDESYDYKRRLRDVIKMNFPDDRIKGIFVTNATVDMVAETLAESGLAGVYKIVGFDLTNETRKLLKDNVISATVCSDTERQGYLAVRVLYDRIARGIIPENIYRYTEFQLLLKELL